MLEQGNTRKLNVGCGRNALAGWINLDFMPLPGVDIVADLDACDSEPLPIDDDSTDEFLLSHVLEHIRKPLPLMQELYRIARPDALCVVRCPHGASDDAWTDPTHLRPYYHGSFGYFSQPYYWRADYGYRGDWQPRTITLAVEGERFADVAATEIFSRMQTERNVVREMIVELVAVKPIREPKRELQRQPKLAFTMV